MIWLLFVLIQLVNIPLMVLGWLMPAPVARMLWLWGNTDDDVLLDTMSLGAQYVYLAWRNPVGNLRHVPGVSSKGRPLFYRTWRSWYFKCGWMSDGYPCLSAGAGRGY